MLLIINVNCNTLNITTFNSFWDVTPREVDEINIIGKAFNSFWDVTVELDVEVKYRVSPLSIPFGMLQGRGQE